MLGVQRFGPTIPRFVAEPAGGAEGGGRVSEPPALAVAVPGDTPAGSSRAEALTEREAWTILMGVSGIGPVTLGELLAAIGSGRRVIELAGEVGGAERIHETVGSGELSLAVARRIVDAAQTGRRLLERLEALAIRTITIEDEAYPRRLRLVEMPPPLLFVRGEDAALNATYMVSVVGTRWPTDRGRVTAGWIGSALANAGACVVSGLAVGIDGVAHAATLAERGLTVGVLGGGHARLFPRAHERLADAIVQGGGAVVSELPPDTSPSRGTFPRRNRLVSGMADATVVVEAGHRSGALITAGWALEQGRECFLVPGPLDAPMNAGCLAFLRSFPGQARVVAGIPELLEDLGLATVQPDGNSGGGDGVAGSDGAAGSAGSRGASMPPATSTAAALAMLNPAERAVAERLSHGPATLDELVAACAGTAASTLSVLTLLELRGLAVASYGRYIAAGPLARQPIPARGRRSG